VTVQQFIGDWWFWGKPRKGIALCQWALVVLIAWALLPKRLYLLAGGIAAAATLASLAGGSALARLYSGPWACT
jgi:hypothetical protein